VSRPRGLDSARHQLARAFRLRGYVRRQDKRRLTREGYMRYKKGDEVRLMANSAAEVMLLQRLLRRAGFKPGRAFAKGRQYRQPIYGREQVRQFLEMVDALEDA